MKELYLIVCGQPKRLEISDERLELIQYAKDRVYEVGLERDWQVSIEVNLTAPTESEITHDSTLIARINWHDGHLNNIHSRILKQLTDRINGEWIQTDIGHYCYEGWETALDFQDFYSLPNVWFHRRFIDSFTDPERVNRFNDEEEATPGLDLLTDASIPLFLPKLYRNTLEQLRDTKISSLYGLDRHYLERVAFVIQDIKAGERSFLDLQRIYEHKMSHLKYLDDNESDFL